MNLGISLAWDYLGGESNNEEGKIFTEIFGPADKSLIYLKKLGLNSIEARHFNHGISPERIPGAVKLVKESGLDLTVHGLIEENFIGMGIYEMYPWLETVMKYGDYSDKKPLIVTIHPLDGKTETREYYEDKTVEVFDYLYGQIDKEGLPFIIAAEINQNRNDKGVSSPAYDFEGLLSIYKRLKNKRLRFCFDFGHMFANVIKKTLENEVPDEFAKKVVQTHIHDLGPGDKTHWPLLYDKVPLEKYVNILKRNGYKGAYNLELTFRRFYNGNSDETRIMLEKTIENLKKAVAD